MTFGHRQVSLSQEKMGLLSLSQSLYEAERTSSLPMRAAIIAALQGKSQTDSEKKGSTMTRWFSLAP